MTRVDDHMAKALEKHHLHEWRGGPDVRGFLMRATGTMSMSCTILGYRDGVAIMGDIAPGCGVCIERKDIEWFAGDLSESYLLEKASIPKVWQAECAAAWVRNEITQTPGGKHDCWTELAVDLEDRAIDTDHEFADALEEAGYVIDDGLPGYDYVSADAAWLCAIQQRFAALYRARVTTEAVR